jgi:hypothetical protein
MAALIPIRIMKVYEFTWSVLPPIIKKRPKMHTSHEKNELRIQYNKMCPGLQRTERTAENRGSVVSALRHTTTTHNSILSSLLLLAYQAASSYPYFKSRD